MGAGRGKNSRGKNSKGYNKSTVLKVGQDDTQPAKPQIDVSYLMGIRRSILEMVEKSKSLEVDWEDNVASYKRCPKKTRHESNHRPLYVIVWKINGYFLC